MSSKNLNKELEQLEMQVYQYFNELLEKQREIVKFDKSDLEHETSDDYLEMHNDIIDNVFDIHPLKVSQNGILVVEADGSFVRHLIKLQDLSSTQDKIPLIQLMENSLNK
jgi:hypothetical protein